VLRLNFRTTLGDSPTVMLAACVRFCADGTLRGPDNFVIANFVDGCWQVGGRLHREVDCEGPVRMRLTLREKEPVRLLGPFQHVRTSGGVLYGDDSCLEIAVPGRGDRPDRRFHQLTLLCDGGVNGKD
jgi:hypothetical protein